MLQLTSVLTRSAQLNIRYSIYSFSELGQCRITVPVFVYVIEVLAQGGGCLMKHVRLLGVGQARLQVNVLPSWWSTLLCQSVIGRSWAPGVAAYIVW